MKTKKLVTILLVLGSFMAVAGTSSANVISFSGNVSFDHDQVVSIIIFKEVSLDYTFLSDTVSLSQFDPGLGILNSVELIVESAIDVETYYWYAYPSHTTSQWWYSDVIGSVEGLEATFSQAHHHHTTGTDDYNHVFSIDGTASESVSSGLAAFIGTGTVDVAITGDDRLSAWWNGYHHYDTDTYGTVTATLTYNYALLEIDIKPGSYPSSINLKSKGVTPVAIHTTGDFDATTVDPETVELEGVPAVKSKICDCDEVWDPDLEEMVGDGDDDLVVYFDTQALAAVLSPGDTEATLTGQTFGGVFFQGTGDVRIVVKGKP